MINNANNTNIAFIGLGSNLKNPKKQIETAVELINHSENIVILKKSRLYETTPYGYLNQNTFINAVIKISTDLDCYALLSLLQKIEQLQHRTRVVRWGPRTLDLDLLAYNNLVIQTTTLNLPHPDLHNRIFVLQPWAEIEPTWQLPDGRCIKDLLAKILEQTP